MLIDSFRPFLHLQFKTDKNIKDFMLWAVSVHCTRIVGAEIRRYGVYGEALYRLVWDGWWQSEAGRAAGVKALDMQTLHRNPLVPCISDTQTHRKRIKHWQLTGIPPSLPPSIIAHEPLGCTNQCIIMPVPSLNKSVMPITFDSWAHDWTDVTAHKLWLRWTETE